MNNDKFKQDMRNTFNNEVPDPLENIKSDPRFFVPQKNTGFSLRGISNKKVFAGILSVFVLTLIIVTSLSRLSTPVVASTVTIDINPSIIVTLDEEDNVINAKGLNNDGETVIDKDTTYRGMTIEEFIDILVKHLEDNEYITDAEDAYNIILFNIDTNNESKKAQIQQRFQNEFSRLLNNNSAGYWLLNSDDIELTNEQRRQIREQSQLSTQTQARLVLVYRLNSLQDDYTVEELSDMTLIQLYNLYLEHETLDNLPDYDDMPGNKWNKK